MQAERKTFLEFAFAGIPTCGPIEVTERTLEGVRVPAGAYGFCFYDKVTLSESYDEEEIALWTQLNQSPPYYLGYLYTIEEVADQVSGSDHLLQLMLENEWQKAILTMQGTWLPWDEGDLVVAPEEVGLGASVA